MITQQDWNDLNKYFGMKTQQAAQAEAAQQYIGAKIAKPHDPVNHPAHYTSHPSGIECIQITEHMNFNIGNAVKYLWRQGLKGGTQEEQYQDLLKARWYIEREISRVKKTL